MDIEEHGAGVVADVSGVKLAPGKFPDQPCIHCSEGKLSRFRKGAGAGNVVEDPRDLGGREIGIDEKPGLLLNAFTMTFGSEALAEVGGPAVLPDDGIAERLSGFAVPDNRGFTLVGDADCRDICRFRMRLS